MRVAELSADDFHLDRYLYFSCRDDRERFCEHVCVSFSNSFPLIHHDNCSLICILLLLTTSIPYWKGQAGLTDSCLSCAVSQNDRIGPHGCFEYEEPWADVLMCEHEASNISRFTWIDRPMLNMVFVFCGCRPRWERAECTNACSTINLRKQCQKRCGTSLVTNILNLIPRIMGNKLKLNVIVSSFLFLNQIHATLCAWNVSFWSESHSLEEATGMLVVSLVYVLSCLSVCVLYKHLCSQCRNALTTRQKLIAQDYKVSYSLAKACKADLRKHRCNPDTSMPRAREARLSFLLLCLESAVHRGLFMSFNIILQFYSDIGQWYLFICQYYLILDI